MKITAILWSACISGAMAFSIAPAAAAVPECQAGKPVAASYTWDFKGEVNTIFRQVEFDARQAADHAGTLWSYREDPNLTWASHAQQLDDIKADINDIGSKLCRLESIRRLAAPWQRHEIDHITNAARLMADNAQDAISFGNAKPDLLWVSAYRMYLNNLYHETTSLRRSVGNAIETGTGS